ncbi:MAG TPA: glycosyltransferase family 4 protein [Planctomycetota bacterium]|jgi:glycosyltransferase involved in cell wall biosynthesis
MARRLVIAQADFHHHWGGQAEVVLALSKALAARGHRLMVLCPPTKVTAGKIEESDLSSRAREAGLETFTDCQFTKGFRPISLWRDVSCLGRLLKKEGVEIYHCHGSQDHWIGALSVVTSSPATRIIRTRHNIYPVANNVFNRWLFRKKTAQVVTIFRAQSKFFTETGLLSAERLFTLPPPLTTEFVNPGNVERVVRKELRLSDEAPLVGFVANFHPDKAPLDFVAMAQRVSGAFPAAHFAMAGHGPLDEAIRAEVAKAGLADRLHMLGFRKDILQVMASFDLVVLTSVAREASSTVLKQAGAVGVPAVATDVGGTREVLDDGKTGLIVPPGDVEALTAAVTTLLTERARAAEMGRAGRKKVLREFTAERIAERMEEMYFRVV